MIERNIKSSLLQIRMSALLLVVRLAWRMCLDFFLSSGFLFTFPPKSGLSNDVSKEHSRLAQQTHPAFCKEDTVTQTSWSPRGGTKTQASRHLST